MVVVNPPALRDLLLCCYSQFQERRIFEVSAEQRKYSKTKVAAVDINRQLARMKDHSQSNKPGRVELSVQTLPLNHFYLYIRRKINEISDF